MGSGSYSASVKLSADGTKSYARADSARHMKFMNSSMEQNFTQKQLHVAMNPKGVTVRESRDSDEHPNSLAIVLGLDVTGSMQQVPHYLVQTGLPNIMGQIMEQGIKDPQILFVGIGDHECDSSPLQVSQFESSDVLLDKWLTELYLEGGGGGNDGESYHLAWYFAAKHTSIDCFEKRKEKGFLFTIGDEPVLNSLPQHAVSKIMGPGQHADFTTKALLTAAQKTYHVYHLHIAETMAGRRRETIERWQDLIGAENVIVIKSKEDVAKTIAGIVSKHAEQHEAPVVKVSKSDKKEKVDSPETKVKIRPKKKVKVTV